MRRIADHDAVPGASESELLAVRMLAEAYKRVTVGERDWLPTCRIDCQQVLHGGPVRGLHRRRGVKGRLHVARAVRVRARRVLGAATVIGVVTGLCLAAFMGLTHSGNSSIPTYQKPENPFLHTTPRKPDSGAGAAGSRLPPRSVSLGLGVPVTVRTTSVPQTPPLTSSPTTSPTPSASASTSSSQSPTPLSLIHI